MSYSAPSLFDDEPAAPVPSSLAEQLRLFTWDGRRTTVERTIAMIDGRSCALDTFVNEFWTSRQRAAHSLHEVSYRACFKPQLPRFFIERLTTPGGVVYDPFMGRGTTVLEGALLERTAIGCDINPLSRILVAPRLDPPDAHEVNARLAAVNWSDVDEWPEDLLTFYHPETLRAICALKTHLARAERRGGLDRVDAWIRMVAVNRLTGHSPGFFSVYTLPPNQAASVTAQRKINADRGQTPPRRDVRALILRKTRALLADVAAETRRRLTSMAHRLVTAPAATTPAVGDSSVDLVVTSPPFLDVVNYAGDNWLRCWFCGIDPDAVPITMSRRVEDWRATMSAVFVELARVLRPGGHVAFEVGEVRSGSVRLEEHVVPCGVNAGLEPLLVLINTQRFTKTAACWGVDNNAKGTNTNRIVLFRRP